MNDTVEQLRSAGYAVIRGFLPPAETVSVSLRSAFIEEAMMEMMLRSMELNV